jgi:Chaperone of endosialidase
MKLNLKRQTHLKTTTAAFLVALALSSFGLSPKTEAVTPPPDGGYPGGNTAEGQNALLSLTSGSYNTAVGYLSLLSDTTGQLNTAVGAGTLLANHADENTATGAGALLSNDTGGQNTADGAFALSSNTSGVRNTASGDRALFSNTIGALNTAYGAGSLALNTEGIKNTASGFNALTSNVAGAGNTAVGFNALLNQISGDGNIALGIQAGIGVTTASNVICVGAEGEDVDDSCYIGNIFGTTLSDGVAVLISSTGRLGTITSSKRFKEEIKPMDCASEAVFALKPVTFRYKKQIDPQRIPQYGLVAEEVEKVNPDLVVHDKNGKPYSVRYDQVNAMLLNEFLKEHNTVQELKKEVATLTATVKEQASQIHKVSVQVEVIKTARQVVLKDQ